MDRTKESIETLANAFCQLSSVQHKALYVASLEALVRLAISEHIAAPVLAVQEDMRRVVAIQAASKVK
jgi:hypothetical protein